MKYKIACRTYRDWNECPTLCESYLEIEARFFKIENGFVAAWFEDIRTWGLQDYDRIKVQVTERKAEDGEKNEK